MAPLTKAEITFLSLNTKDQQLYLKKIEADGQAETAKQLRALLSGMKEIPLPNIKSAPDDLSKALAGNQKPASGLSIEKSTSKQTYTPTEADIEFVRKEREKAGKVIIDIDFKEMIDGVKQTGEALIQDPLGTASAIGKGIVDGTKEQYEVAGGGVSGVVAAGANLLGIGSIDPETGEKKLSASGLLLAVAGTGVAGKAATKTAGTVAKDAAVVIIKDTAKEAVEVTAKEAVKEATKEAAATVAKDIAKAETKKVAGTAEKAVAKVEKTVVKDVKKETVLDAAEVALKAEKDKLRAIAMKDMDSFKSLPSDIQDKILDYSVNKGKGELTKPQQMNGVIAQDVQIATLNTYSYICSKNAELAKMGKTIFTNTSFLKDVDRVAEQASIRIARERQALLKTTTGSTAMKPAIEPPTKTTSTAKIVAESAESAVQKAKPRSRFIAENL